MVLKKVYINPNNQLFLPNFAPNIKWSRSFDDKCILSAYISIFLS